jgi:aspartate-semialdehyde dehydrogenase
MCRPNSTAHAGSRLRHSPPTVAIVGATGAVGRELLQILEQRRFPLAELRLYASPRSAGTTLAFAGHAVPVAALSKTAFDRIDLALFSAGSAIARQWARAAAGAGAIVIDNSSAFRMDPAVPLVVPEINGEKIATHSGTSPTRIALLSSP